MTGKNWNISPVLLALAWAMERAGTREFRKKKTRRDRWRERRRDRGTEGQR